MNKSKRHIYLITTEGCRGCKIQQKNIEKALATIKENINFHVSDYTKFKHNNEYDKFKDFPTTLYVYDGETLGREIGSETVGMIRESIYNYFDIKRPDVTDHE